MIRLDGRENGPADIERFPMAGSGSKTVLYGDIQIAGEFDPSTSKPGLALLRNILIFDASKWGPCHAFTFLRSMEDLKIRHGLYMESESCLIWNGKGFQAGGKGHLAWVLPKPQEGGADGIDIAQFRPGESLPPEFSAVLAA